MSYLIQPHKERIFHLITQTYSSIKQQRSLEPRDPQRLRNQKSGS